MSATTIGGVVLDSGVVTASNITSLQTSVDNINTSAPIYTVSNAGGGTVINNGKTGNDLAFKTIEAGAGIQFTEAAGKITIAGTDAAIDLTSTSIVPTFTPPTGWVGTQGTLYLDKVSTVVTLQFSGATTSNVTTPGVFTQAALLPAAYRPARNIFAIGKGFNSNSNSFIQYAITSGGNVTISADLGANFTGSACGWANNVITYTIN